MQTSDFDFELPEHLIALRPAVPRTSAKMLVSDAAGVSDHQVHDILKFLRAGDRLVLNDTKVIPARLKGLRKRDTTDGSGIAKIEVTLMEAQSDGNWRIMAKPLRKLKADDIIEFDGGLTATCVSRTETDACIHFSKSQDQLDDALEKAGEMPLPPYIAGKRPTDAQDKHDYQTVWAKHSGAVAAPTASLHFDDALLADLRAHSVEITYVTLHVGAGTFLPVTVDDPALHKMHKEWGEVSDQAASEIQKTREAGGRIIPVGTTALRVIETAAQGGQIKPWTGMTDIFIYPGFIFNVTDGLMTNFHLPKSTLLMLVAALIGKPKLVEIYQHAIANDYRFFSYGDSSLLFRD